MTNRETGMETLAALTTTLTMKAVASTTRLCSSQVSFAATVRKVPQKRLSLMPTSRQLTPNVRATWLTLPQLMPFLMVLRSFSIFRRLTTNRSAFRSVRTGTFFTATCFQIKTLFAASLKVFKLEELNAVFSIKRMSPA